MTQEGASIPELDKILGMSKIFGVTTDYLLKDEIDFISGNSQDGEGVQTDGFLLEQGASEREVHSISLEEARTYLQTLRQAAVPMAAGVLLCISSPICLLIMSGWATNGPVAITESQATGFGMTILLLFVAAAVALFIYYGMKIDKYEFMEKDELYLQYGVRGILEKEKDDFSHRYRQSIAVGVILCILSALPLFIMMIVQAPEIYYVYSTCMLLAIVSAGVFLMIRVCLIYGGYQKLLQEGDYTVEKKRSSSWTEAFGGTYWCLIVAIYLGISFARNNWEISWVIWPVAALIYAALLGVFSLIASLKKR